MGKLKALAKIIQDLENLDHGVLKHYDSNIKNLCDLLVARLESKSKAIKPSFNIPPASFVRESFFSEEYIDKLKLFSSSLLITNMGSLRRSKVDASMTLLLLSKR